VQRVAVVVNGEQCLQSRADVDFEINRVESIRPQSHDQRFDWIATEAGQFQVAA